MKERLEKALKILTKRQLTDREIQLTKTGLEIDKREAERKWYSRTRPGKEEELVIEKILFEYTSYFDASNEWKGPEWLPYLNEMRIHNSKGELLERRVYNGRTGIHQRAKITKYNPPGRFVGEIIRSEGYGYY